MWLIREDGAGRVPAKVVGQLPDRQYSVMAEGRREVAPAHRLQPQTAPGPSSAVPASALGVHRGRSASPSPPPPAAVAPAAAAAAPAVPAPAAPAAAEPPQPATARPAAEEGRVRGDEIVEKRSERGAKEDRRRSSRSRSR